MRRITFAIAISIIAVLIGAGAATRSIAADAGAAQVNIDNFSFSPATLKVKADTTVTWTNRDDIPHTVVANDKSFKSKVLDTGDAFSFTPTKPGTYPYFCSIHPKMTGVLIVE